MKSTDPIRAEQASRRSLKLFPKGIPTVSLLALAALGSLESAFGQIEYTLDGTPTPLEEEIRWHMNRGRFNSARENQNRGTAYTDVPASAPPVAPHQSLTLASRHHSEDLARNNLFQHETVPGSAYYNAATQPNFWNRMAAEGYYVSYPAGENIAAGYDSAEAAYVGWWNSSGHRYNMFNVGLREIGNGYFRWDSSTYVRYYTMGLASSGGHFFTDTLFSDINADGTYDIGDGVAGVRVELRIGTIPHTYYDVSATAGNFAIPLQSLPYASTIKVVLVNSSASTVQLTIPRDYDVTTTVTLASGQEQLLGTFVRPAGITNVGLRNLTPASPSAVVTQVTLARTAQGFELRWPSETGVEYLPQASTNLNTWTDLTPSYILGTGTTLMHLDPAPGVSYRFYRLMIRRP